jgi:predicted Zn-dependent peptidase
VSSGERSIRRATRSGRPTFDEAEEAIRRITREDLVAFHDHQYGPDGLILVLAGT